MSRGLRRRMLLASAALATLVAAAFVPLLLAVREQRDAERSARASQAAVGQANEAEKLLLDAETGVRGYVITRDERFLEPYTSARQDLPPQTRNLVQDLQDDPAQEQRARTVDRRARAYVNGYAARIVALTRRDPSAARRAIATGDGKATVDGLRSRFARIRAEEEARTAARSDDADAAARRALEIGIVSVLAAVALVLLFGFYLGRAIVEPVGRLAEAAKRLARGDLAARVPDEGRGEIGELSASFNTMASSLEESRDELESQNTELGLQAAELEDQKHELAEVNDELRAQRDELEHAGAELAAEKDRVERFGAFADRLAAEPRVEPLADLVLTTLADAIGAEVGALHARRTPDGELELLATRGLDPDTLAAPSGMAARAVAEGRTLALAGPATAMTVTTLAGERSVRRELHVPLRAGAEPHGVVSLGSLDGEDFEARDVATANQLAGQAAVALANAFAGDASRRLATITGAVVDGVTDGIVLTAPDGRVLMANVAARRLGRDPEADALLHPPGRADAETFDEIALESSGRVFQRVTAPVQLPDGEPLGRLTVSRDVTRERAADEVKSELVATVSHELRTPLASVLGYTELLLARETDPETRERCLRAVHAEATRLRELIDDFLDLQRIERGGVEPDVERLDLRNLLTEQVQRLGGVSERHTLEVDAPAEPLVVDADRTRIGQVVSNLVSNAIKYSPDGGPVRIEARRDNGDVRIAVADTGIGIPSDQQDQVFERFFRARHPGDREIGGTGLGLALVREIVEAHGGTVGFESVESRGSRFWFTVPAAGADGVTAGEATPGA